VMNGSIPPDGNGLSPLLRHPLMIIHPPMLYLGYTGFVIPFSFAMAALIVGRVDDGWIRTTRRWSLVAWLFLGLGLILGGRWAHDVLGWGGYWAWDPVENAAFMPWLAGTAFLHSVMIQEKRGMFKMWNMFLIILTYLMIVYGTLIVRTGLLDSVHSFAESDIQWHFFGFTTFMILFSTFWATYRADNLRSNNYLTSIFSREAAFLINNFVIVAILLIIFLFTNYSLLSELFTGQEYGVGEATYEMAVGPLFGFLLLLMGVAPLTMWYRTSLKRLGRLASWPAIIATGTIVVLVLLGIHQIGALIGLWIVFFSGILTVLEYVKGAQARVKKGESWLVALGKLFQRNQRRYGGYLIHLGIIVMGFGIIGTEFFQEQTQVFLQSGEQVAIDNYILEFEKVEFMQLDDISAAQATTHVYDADGNFLRTLQPRTEVFETGEGMTHPDAISGLGKEFYVIMVNWEGVTADGATVRIYLTPLINWVWAGGFLFLFGTLIAAWPDELDQKIVVAERRRREIPAPAVS
ncbi:MAG: cytochrome c biogenesis protein CcsA, partial [Anaerolineales bacterium]|nr:cytochrome c biogenesis protein CcsA [Anaerolineales bacterium]